MELLGTISVDFGVTNQLLMRFLYLSDTGKKLEYNGTLLQLFIDFKKSYVSTRKEVLYIILIEFWVPMKLFRLIKLFK
jgi:hypothetical protein